MGRTSTQARLRTALCTGLAALLLATMVSVGVARPVAAAEPPPLSVAQADAFRLVLGDLKVTVKVNNLAAVLLQKQLVTLANQAFQQATAGKTCAAVGSVRTLQTLVTTAGALLGPAVATLVADVLSLLAVLLGDPASIACGGATGAPSETVPATGIGASDTNHLVVHVAFPSPTFVARTGGGATYQQMSERGAGMYASAVGDPELPNVALRFAVPDGATVSARVIGSSGYNLAGVDLWPRQPAQLAEGADPRFPEPDFTRNPSAYSAVAPMPASPIVLTGVTPQRELKVASMSLAGGQYSAATKTLRVFTGMDVELTFGGGNRHVWGSSLIMSPWEAGAMPLYYDLVNFGALRFALEPVPPPSPLCGEELLIISAPLNAISGNSWANTRRSDGLVTRAVALGDPGVPTDKEGIREFIKRELHAPGCLHPTAVLILGSVAANVDAGARVPTWDVSVGPQNPKNYFSTPSDLPYTLIDQADEFDHWDYSNLNSSLVVGRVTGGMGTTMRALGKIGRYLDAVGPDQNPLPADAFTRATMTSGFDGCTGDGCMGPRSTQDQGHFLKEAYWAEQIIAAERPATDMLVGHNSKDRPMTFDNGTTIPSDVALGASKTTIDAAFNAGRFLVASSYHGSIDGWQYPDYNNAAAVALQNPVSPVVWSMGCDTGKLQDNALVFAEALIESNHGAAGVYAPSRFSRVPFDGTFIQSLANTMFPKLANAEADRNSSSGVSAFHRFPVTRFGDVLFAARHDLAAQILPGGTGVGGSGAEEFNTAFYDQHQQIFEFNAFGDPSMEVWTDTPRRFDLARSSVSAASSTVVRVALDGQPDANGALVNLRDAAGQFIGRGVLLGGEAVIEVSGGMSNAALNGMSVVFSKEGYVAAERKLQAPVLTAIQPASGLTSGGEEITLVGRDFDSQSAVKWGGANLQSTLVDSTHLKVIAPRKDGAGPVDVSVSNLYGSSEVRTYTYSFAAVAPHVSDLSPPRGPTAGGAAITVAGSGLGTVTAVHFGTISVPFTISSDHFLVATSPPGNLPVNVTVTNPVGTSPENVVFAFEGTPVTVTGVTPSTVHSSDTFTAAPYSVLISGTGFTGATAVDLRASGYNETHTGGDIELVSDSQILLHNVTLGSDGFSRTVNVVVHLGDSVSPVTTASRLSFIQDAPNITFVDPRVGTPAGGETVTISGTSFARTLRVLFGSQEAVIVSVAQNQVVVRAPAWAGGDTVVDIRVVTPAGTSPVNSNATYRYLFPGG